MIALYFLTFLVSSASLVYLGTQIVKLLTRLARFLELKEFVVASILMSFITSLPELFVGITAAINNKSILALGNVMGSNIIVLTLVIGIGGLLANGLSFKEKTLQRSASYATLIAPIPLFLMLDGHLSRWDGLVLYLTFAFYFHQLSLQKERFVRILNGQGRKGKTGKQEKRKFLGNVLISLLAIALLLVSSEGVVWSAGKLSTALNLPMSLIGIFLVALGTSGPELAFGIRSISLKHEEMALGDCMGSVVMNSTFILGTVSLINPFAVPDLYTYFVGVGFTVSIAMIFLIFIKTDRTISKKEALILVLLYLLFFFVENLNLMWFSR